MRSVHVQQNKQSSGCAGEEAGNPLMQPQQSEQNHSRHARYAVQGCSSACGTLFSVLGPPRSLAAVEALYSAHNMAQGEQHARSLIHACIHSSTHLFVRLFVVHSCMHSFFLSFARAFARCFVYPFVPLQRVLARCRSQNWYCK